MLEFVLNDRLVSTTKPTGSLLLDFVRYDEQMTGTKIGCREGDCGACTVLIGEYQEGQMIYRNVTSCLTPIGNVAGKHVVTIEGLNMSKLTPVQQAMVDEGGTQCGFCTVGFIVSLTGFCFANKKPKLEDAITAIDGNICRCTGYKSIERAAERLVDLLADKSIDGTIQWLIEQQFIPTYFAEIPAKLEALNPRVEKVNGKPKVGGGTDLYVQKHDALVDVDVTHLFNQDSLKGIRFEDGTCILGAGTTVSEFMGNEQLKIIFPKLSEQMKLVSSSPIRNISTIAGNFVNASPIGDLTAFFLALDASIYLDHEGATRSIFLKDFYQGYKVLDKAVDEIITGISFPVPTGEYHFNFEKVSKRTYLDIASVNSACLIKLDGDIIVDVHLSAGGIGPTPTYLERTRMALMGEVLNAETVTKAQLVMQEEISPISDVRGTEEYKRLLLQQLYFAHFLHLFPHLLTLNALV